MRGKIFVYGILENNCNSEPLCLIGIMAPEASPIVLVKTAILVFTVAII